MKTKKCLDCETLICEVSQRCMPCSLVYRTFSFDKLTKEWFLSQVIIDENTGCWRWQGVLNKKGYALKRIGKENGVHRISYKFFIGPIPEGLVIDHVLTRGCLYRDCINPNHLEPVTNEENWQRGKKPRLRQPEDFCTKGHSLLDPSNQYTKRKRQNGKEGRSCLICRKQATATQSKNRSLKRKLARQQRTNRSDKEGGPREEKRVHKTRNH